MLGRNIEVNHCEVAVDTILDLAVARGDMDPREMTLQKSRRQTDNLLLHNVLVQEFQAITNLAVCSLLKT